MFHDNRKHLHFDSLIQKKKKTFDSRICESVVTFILCLQVYYTFKPIFMLAEPLMLASVFFLFYVACLAYLHNDLSIRKWQMLLKGLIMQLSSDVCTSFWQWYVHSAIRGWGGCQHYLFNLELSRSDSVARQGPFWATYRTFRFSAVKVVLNLKIFLSSSRI